MQPADTSNSTRPPRCEPTTGRTLSTGNDNSTGKPARPSRQNST
ncbi:hypothetical protein NKH18_39920 [Streptomyces sp. M10(2022)]